MMFHVNILPSTLNLQRRKRSLKRNQIRRFAFSGRKETTPSEKEKAEYSDAEFEAAKEYIMDCYERAQTDFDYAAEQYERDMELTAVDEYVRRVTDV